MNLITYFGIKLNWLKISKMNLNFSSILFSSTSSFEISLTLSLILFSNNITELKKENSNKDS